MNQPKIETHFESNLTLEGYRGEELELELAVQFSSLAFCDEISSSILNAWLDLNFDQPADWLVATSSDARSKQRSA